MADLLTAGDRLSYETAMNDLHDTFGRDITIWKSSAQTITTSPSSDYDAFYDQKKPQVTYTAQSFTIKARIKYLDRQDKEFVLAMSAISDKIDVTFESRIVRIKVKEEDSPLVHDAEKVTIDGMDYGTLSAPRPGGSLNLKYITYYLSSSV